MTVKTASEIFRDFATESDPTSGAHKPVKADIRAWGANQEALTAAGALTAAVFKATKSALDSDLAHAAGVLAVVYADSTAANNAIYIKSGSSGSGSWGLVGYLPTGGVVKASNTNSGNANALTATTPIATSEFQIILLPVVAANTTAAPTVAFNGGSALTIKDVTNTDLPIAGLQNGMVVAGIISGGAFRLLSDFNYSTAAAAAEAARVAAVAAQAAAEAAQTAAETAKTNAETAETNAETAETNAEAAEASAEAALASIVAALAAADIYTDTTLAAAITAGLAAVADTERFWATGVDVDYIALYEDDSGSEVFITSIPKHLVPDAVTSANSTTWRPGENVEAHGLDGYQEWDFWSPLKTAESIELFAQDGSNSRIHISYNTENLGFAEDGILTELTIRTRKPEGFNGTALATTTGAKAQAWVVRPSATLPTTHGVSVTVSKVAAIGEADLDDSQADYLDNIRFSGLSIPVQAGDLIALRIVGAGIRYATASGGTTEYDNEISLLITDTDTTLAAIATSKTASTLKPGRRFFHKATIVPRTADKTSNAPGGLVRLDGAARLPAYISRVADAPWQGKKIFICGSSISTVSGGGVASATGHLPIAMQMLGADPAYLSVGGSYGTWPASSIGGTVASQFIAGTAAEFTSRFGSATYSYENTIIGQSFDAILLHDMINDSNGGIVVGSLNDGNPATIYGALQRMIDAILADNPQCQIFLQTPAHRWASYGGSGTPTEQANRIQYADAMIALGAWYGLPVIDYIRNGGIGPSRVSSGNGLYDTIHPQIGDDGPRKIMARYVYSMMIRHARAE